MDAHVEIRTAFPVSVQADVDAAMLLMPRIGEMYYCGPNGADVRVNGESVRIPGCVGFKEPGHSISLAEMYHFYETGGQSESRIPKNCRDHLKLVTAIFEKAPAGVPRDVLTCLLSRHFCGFVRERFAPNLARIDKPWVAPYILMLTGERVVEILTVIRPHVDMMDRETFLRFARENADFVRRTRQRVISHWNRWGTLREYPGFQILDSLGLWPRRWARRLLRS